MRVCGCEQQQRVIKIVDQFRANTQHFQVGLKQLPASIKMLLVLVQEKTKVFNFLYHSSFVAAVVQ